MPRPGNGLRGGLLREAPGERPVRRRDVRRYDPSVLRRAACVRSGVQLRLAVDDPLCARRRLRERSSLHDSGPRYSLRRRRRARRAPPAPLRDRAQLPPMYDGAERAPHVRAEPDPRAQVMRVPVRVVSEGLKLPRSSAITHASRSGNALIPMTRDSEVRPKRTSRVDPRGIGASSSR